MSVTCTHFPLPPGRAPRDTPFQIPMVANPFTLDTKPPTIQQWNLTPEQQVLQSAVMSLAYEGSRGFHLIGSVEGNAAVYNPAETEQQNVANYNIRRPMGESFQGFALGKNIQASSCRLGTAASAIQGRILQFGESGEVQQSD